MAQIQFVSVPSTIASGYAGQIAYQSSSTLNVYFGTALDPSILPILESIDQDINTPELELLDLDGTQVDFPWIAEMLAALESATAIANISIQQTSDASTADLQVFGYDNLTSSGASILQEASSPGEVFDASGDYGYGAVNTADAQMQVSAETGGGSFLSWQLLQQAGTLLGLGGLHNAQNGSTEFFDGLAFDNERYSVMSRTDLSASTADDHGHAVSFMALDIAALHHMYGADMTAHVTDTTYKLTDAGTAALDLDGDDGTVSIGRAYYSIWDAGGNDTISYNGQMDALINLNTAQVSNNDLIGGADPELGFLVDTILNSGALRTEFMAEVLDAEAGIGGYFSRLYDINGDAQAGGISIAENAVIENATGGAGADLLIGNNHANELRGNDNNDVIFGGGGDDLIIGGNGDDKLYGVDGVNDIRGGSGNDELWASYFGNTLNGGSGNDLVVGDFGDDTLKGGSGDDMIAGGFGNDLLVGGSGFDQLIGEAGDDVLKGGNDDDILQGDSFMETGNDKLYGNNGNDQLFGNAGDDSLFGGSGNDELYGETGTDKLRGGSGNDLLDGGEGNDNLKGGADDDVLLGGAGNDTLVGEAGADVLDGGTGDDILKGASSGELTADTFVYKDGGYGFDKVKGFEDGLDQIDLSDFAFTDFATDVQSLASQSGNHLDLDFGGGNVLRIENFALADFDAGDVIL